MADLIEDISKNIYTTVLGDGDVRSDAKIVIGGESVTDRFLPNVNSCRWDDEAFVNLNYSAMTISTEKESFVDGKIDIESGDVKFETYVLNEGVLEIVLYFASRPISDDIEFDVTHSSGLRWCYQGELSQDEIDEGCQRPENVVGSYALIWSKKNNKYKSGKFKHLYSWKLTDSKASESLARLEYVPLTKTTGTLKVKCDKNWLDKAVYPIKAMGNGDTMGLTTAGATNASFGSADRARWAFLGDPGENGTLNYVGTWMYRANNSTYAFKLASIYDNSGTFTLIEAGPELYDANCLWSNWEFNDTTIDHALTSGTDYYAGVICKISTVYHTYDDDGGAEYFDDNTYSYASPPSSFDKDATRSGRLLSIWMDYTAAAGPTEVTKTTSLDALIKRVGLTQNFSMDAFLQKSIPITLSLDGLLNLLKTMQTNLDAQLWQSYTKDLSIDSLLQRVGIETSLSIDALLTDQFTKTAAIDGLLQKAGLTLASSLDAVLISGGLTTTTTLDALLNATGLTQTAALDAILGGAGSLTISLDALLQKTGLTTASTIDALLQASGLTTAAGLDAVLQSAGISLQSSLDALLQKSGLTTASAIDALLQASGLTTTAALDAMLGSAGISLQSSLDALLQAGGLTSDLSLDALLQKAGLLKTASLDAYLQKIGATAALSLDAILYAIGIGLMETSLDALLQKSGLLATLSIDALLQRSAAETSVIDALLIKSFTQSVQLDALLQKRGQLKTSNLDAHLYYLRTIAADMDAILYSANIVQSSLDAMLTQLAVTSTATLDALLYQGQLTTLTMDSILYNKWTRSVDMDALLRGTITSTTLLDAIIFSIYGVNARAEFVTVLTKPDFITALTKPTFVYT